MSYCCVTSQRRSLLSGSSSRIRLQSFTATSKSLVPSAPLRAAVQGLDVLGLLVGRGQNKPAVYYLYIINIYEEKALDMS